jgi:peptidoglycan LD-endopeptidase CwlK
MAFELSRTSIDRLAGLHPKLVAVVRAAIAITKTDFAVIEGMRTLEKQREYFNAGKSRTMASKHLTGHAVDLMPIVIDKAETWEERNFLPISDAMFQAARTLGVQLSWGGHWQSFKDCPHFEIDPRIYPQ